MTTATKKFRIAFVTTMDGEAWGGSEELWSQTALRLCEHGHTVFASVLRWPQSPAGVAALHRGGVRVTFRPRKRNFFGRVLQRGLKRFSPGPLAVADRHWLKRTAPDLVVVSQGGPWDGVAWMVACRQLGLPYCGIVHANSELWWPLDERLPQIREAFAGAKRMFFVSHANRALAELQTGLRMTHSDVVANPCRISREKAERVPWPGSGDFVELACVGRIAPKAKGQDILLQILAQPKWRSRSLRLNFYGTGPSEKSIARLAGSLDLPNVRFHGHVSDLRQIWAANHLLALPSRFEGLPLAIIEAMLCGRPVITTDVAGNTELVRDECNGFVAAAPTVPLFEDAMERAWMRRDQWREMGARAFHDVLAAMPDDPIHDFVCKLFSIVSAAPDPSTETSRTIENPSDEFPLKPAETVAHR